MKWRIGKVTVTKIVELEVTGGSRFILPQAIPPVVPALGNYLISMFKETPILALVAVNELMQEAKLIGSESFRYTEPISLAGLFFLVLSLASAFLVRRVEELLNRKVKR